MAFSLYGFIKGLLLQDESDRTKELAITIDPSATTGTRTTVVAAQTVNRTLSLPNATDTLVGKATTDTLTNKTLTTPVINSPTGLVKADVGLGNVDNTSDATKNAATVTLTNKTIDTGQNTITNIANFNIASNAAISALKIANGSVSSAEFQRLAGVTSGIQAQLDNGVNATAVVQGNLDAHIANSTGAHTASAITNVPSGNLTSTNVQSAVNELQTHIDAISTGTSTASNVGSGVGVFKVKVANDLEFKSLVQGSNITVTSNTNDITLSVPGLGTNQIVNNQLAQMPAHTIKGNNTGSTANSLDLTATQVTAELNAFVGDSGSGGTKGLVPAPTIGDSKKFLKGDGTFSSPSYLYVSQSSTLNPAVTGTYYLLSGASFNITLPTAASISGQIVTFRHNGTSLTQVYTFLTTSSQTINGIASGSYALYTNGETLTLISDGSNWQIINHITDTDIINAGAISLSSTGAYVFSWTGNQSIVIGDTYSDGAGNIFTVAATTNTTTGTFSGTPGTPASTGTLTRITGTGIASIVWTSRTITGQPVIGTTSQNSFTWYRQGRFAICNVVMVQSIAGTTGSGEYMIYLPNAMLALSTYPTYKTTGSHIQSTVLAQGAALPGSISMCQITSNAATYNTSTVYLYAANSFRLSDLSDSTGGLNAGQWGSTYFSLGNAALAMNITVTIPIQGWQP